MSATTSLLDRPWPTPDELADARASALELAREAGVTGVAASNVVVTLAPYRVCPLGAHVDHQGGRVLGMALNCGITLAFVPVPDSARLPASTVLLRSDAFAGEVRFDLLDDDESMPPPLSSSAADAPGGWGAYPRGAAAVLRAALRPNPPRRGIVGVVRASPPNLARSGVSSSAALSVACVRALSLAAAADENASDALSRLGDDPLWRTIRLARAVETERVGVKCGVLDQASSILSRRGAVTLVDCATEAHETVRFACDRAEALGADSDSPEAFGDAADDDDDGRGALPFVVLLAHSGLRAALSETKYNARVDEYPAAAIAGIDPRARRLGDVRGGRAAFETFRRSLRRKQETSEADAAFLRRATHYFDEVDRVAAGTAAWRRGDVRAFGSAMNASGVSSIELYECGCEPMNALRATAERAPGVYGARFSGAGFRGCVVALAERARAAEAAEWIAERYARAFPDLAKDAGVVLAESSHGARTILAEEVAM